LVTEVHIGTTAMESMELISPTELEVVFPRDMITGGVLKVVTASGEEVSFSTPVSVVLPAVTPVIASITPASVRPGATIKIAGTDLDIVEKVIFEDDKEVTSEDFISQNANVIEVKVPVDVTENTDISVVVVTTAGERAEATLEIQGPPTGTEPVDDPALVIFDFEDRDGNNAANIAGGWGGIANGKSSAGDGVSGSFYEITAANWNAGAYWWIADNWVEAPFPSVSGISRYVVKMDVRLRNDIPAGEADIRLRIAGNKEANFLPYLLRDGIWSTGGEWVTITIPLSDFSGLEDPTPTGGDWGMVNGWNPNNINFTGFCVDNIRYELIK